MTQRLKQMASILRSTFEHFLQDDCRRHAAALTFTTLFAVVPMMTVVFTALAAIPSLQHVSGDIQGFIFDNLVPTSGAVVRDQLTSFSQQAGQLTIVGIIMLFVTAVMMLVTIEKAFNEIWQVQSARNGLVAFLRYWAVLSLGPFLLGAGFILSSYLMSLKVFSDTAGVVSTVLPGVGLIPVLFTTLGFTLLYTTVPNCRVPWRAGIISGFAAAVLFELAKKGFGFFITSFSSYQLVYGAFAAFPVFLLWIYISWMIILYGVELSRGVALQETFSEGQRHPVLTMLSVLALLHGRHRNGEGVKEVEVMRVVGRQHQADWSSFAKLLDQHKLARTTREGDLVLARDLSDINLLDLLKQLPWQMPLAADFASYPSEPWLANVQAIIAPVEKTMDESLTRSLGQLLVVEVS